MSSLLHCGVRPAKCLAHRRCSINVESRNQTPLSLPSRSLYMAININSTQRNMLRQNTETILCQVFAKQDKRSQLFMWGDLHSEPKPTLFLLPELENCVPGRSVYKGIRRVCRRKHAAFPWHPVFILKRKF